MTTDARSAADAGGDSRVAAELYERLRAWAVDRSKEPKAGLSGLAVLVRGGMHRLLQTCTSAADPVPQPQEAAADVTRHPSASPQAQLAAMLASILLSRPVRGAS